MRFRRRYDDGPFFMNHECSFPTLSLSHQGSCQESCQRVMMTRAAAMIVVMVAGSRETCCKALKCLNMEGYSGCVLGHFREAI